MAEILKFVYNATLFFSLYLVVYNSKLWCDTDADCQEKFPGPSKYPIKCMKGICKCVIN
ncbi:putative Late nodulin [Medicago truncatula]|uniref:Nodule Cysteine-Rich (NCR) secreted peptide n=1 Tax=Medicago truncatula TaxID=3880 RepID=A0A072U873_MEDTR|nr:Nodule Cysteine-Rich (NCR) secreted peptide [Medicago truncatula]RHN51115.1 putative Late nodulin [Medicago truncatula]